MGSGGGGTTTAGAGAWGAGTAIETACGFGFEPHAAVISKSPLAVRAESHARVVIPGRSREDIRTHATAYRDVEPGILLRSPPGGGLPLSFRRTAVLRIGRPYPKHRCLRYRSTGSRRGPPNAETPV